MDERDDYDDTDLPRLPERLRELLVVATWVGIAASVVLGLFLWSLWTRPRLD